MDVNGRFNPMSDLFVAQFAKPAQMGEINLRALTPYQRALLVIDGTVTKFIEAYTMEPVDVIRLGQAVRPLTDDHAWLAAPKGMTVIARQVLERGRYSRTLYAYAVSLVVPDRLPGTVTQGLEVDGGALGRLFSAANWRPAARCCGTAKSASRTCRTPSATWRVRSVSAARTASLLGGSR